MANAEKFIKTVSVFVIACCCVLLIPQTRSFIIEIGEKILGRNLNHDVWMIQLLVYSLLALLCLSVIWVFFIKSVRKYFPEILMIALFLFVSTLIVLRSYFISYEYISPDSSNYLQAAQSILNGYGFRVYAEAGWDGFYFSHWPIGYPFLIACVSKITETEVYLASKILTLLTLAGIFSLLYMRFRKKAWIYALIMVSYSSFLTDFFHAWSEQLFLLGSLWLTFEIIKIISQDKPPIYHYFNILIASLLMFFVRYVGIQAVGIIGLIIVYFIIIHVVKKKNMLAKIIPLLIIGIIVSIVDLGYLYLNYVNTGYFGGSFSTTERGEIRNLTHIIYSVAHLYVYQIRELSYIFHIDGDIWNTLRLSILFAIGCIFFICYKRDNIKAFLTRCSFASRMYFLMSFLTCFIFLVFRSITEVDTHYERHLLVSTILFAFGCLSVFLEVNDGIIAKTKKFLKKYAIFFGCILFVWFCIKPLGLGVLGTDMSYHQKRDALLNELCSVPPKSIIIAEGNPYYYVAFLRPDVLVMYLNWGISVVSYPELLREYENVYLYMDKEHILDTYHLEIMKENSLLVDAIPGRNDKLVKIK